MLGLVKRRSLINRLGAGSRLVADFTGEASRAVIGTGLRTFFRPNPRKNIWNLLLAGTHRPEIFAKLVEQRRRVAILSTYHLLPRFLDYHFRLVDALSAAGFVVQIVHASDFPYKSLFEIDREDRFLFIKRNAGFDFGSYSLGFHLLRELNASLDELVLINDSVFGPNTNLHYTLDTIRSFGADFAGLTDSFERGYHVQSYFVWLGKNVVCSAALAKFFDNHQFARIVSRSEWKKHRIRELVTCEGELSFTRLLVNEGFRGKVLCPYEHVAACWLSEAEDLARMIWDLPAGKIGSVSALPDHYKEELLRSLDRILRDVVAGVPINPTHFFWDTLIEKFEFPFVKRELLTVNPKEVPSFFRISEVLTKSDSGLVDCVREACRLGGVRKIPYICRDATSGTRL